MTARFANFITLRCLLAILTACAAGGSIPTQPPQPPNEYLSNALNWIERYSLDQDIESAR